MRRQNAKNRDSGVVNTEPRDTTLSKLLGVYILVCCVISAAWALGHFEYSFLWVFLLISGLFILWKTKLTNIVQNRLYQEEIRIHRKRALRQSETAEWLNFIVNRWWVFNADTIEEFVKKRLEDRLYTIKPSYLDKLELSVFTFGDHTPSIKYVRSFEYMDGVPGGRKPVSWTNINTPPTGLDKVSSYQLVCELDTQNLLDQFQMVFTAKVGRGRASLGFKIAVEQLRISGVVQMVLHMSKDIPFPHVSKVSLSFVEKPEVYFNMNVLKSVNLTELPLLKNWIYDQVMDGICKAMVDPGQINIPIARVGAVQLKKTASISTQKLAQGVLTIHVIGTAVTDGDTEDVRYATLRVGEQKRTTHDELAINDWDDICSFFVHSLYKEKITLKSKCHRLLSNVTLEQHDIDLSSLPFSVKENVNKTVENKDGGKYELRMQYTPLPQIDLENPEVTQPTDNKSGVLYVCVHGASSLISSDVNGKSDPYCVVFCDRRRLLTTPFIKNSLHPRWESGVEFFVKDYTSVMLSFYVFDWDGTNIIEDDFLGSAFYNLPEGEPAVVRKSLTLGYNKSSEGYVTDKSYGQINVSVVFRPVASVERSEKYRVASVGDSGKKDYLYNEDLVSPSSTPSRSLRQSSKGGGPNHQTSNRKSLKEILPKNKTMVDLTILQGKDLMAMDRNGFSDPFCTVQMGEKRLLKTSVKKKTLFPKWNESTTFEVKDENQMIEILMYDKDFISNDFLGKAVLSLDKLKEISFKNSAEWIKLQRTKSGMLQIKCTVTVDGVPMQRDSDSIGNIDNDVFNPEASPALQVVLPQSQVKEEHQNEAESPQRKDMKPDILPQVDETSSRHSVLKEEIIVAKKETTVASQPPAKSSFSQEHGSPNQSQQQTPQRKSHGESSPQETVQKRERRTSKSTDIDSPMSPPQHREMEESTVRSRRRSNNETSLNTSLQNGDHRYKRNPSPSRHGRRVSRETSVDDIPGLSPDPYKTSTSPQRGRRGRASSDSTTLRRSQSDMTVNNRPGSRYLELPDNRGMQHGDSMNSFTYRDHEESSIAESSREPSLISTDVSESEGLVNHEKLYSVSGEVLEIRGLPKSVTSFYCKIRLQNPHTKFKFGSNSRVIAKSSMIKVNNPVFNTKFEIDRGTGTSVDSLLVFDIKDGRKQHVAQHSFTIGLLFMDYREGEFSKWLALGKGSNVEILVMLRKGNPNARLMRKIHRSSMRMSGEKQYRQYEEDHRDYL